MRFIALVKKEWAESVGSVWIMGVLFLATGGFMTYQMANRLQGGSSHLNLGPPGLSLLASSPLEGASGWLMLTSLCLGVTMAITQFPIFGSRGSWAFTLHRSVRRRTILLAKAAVALLGLAIGAGLPWTILYVYTVHRVELGFLTAPRVYMEGWAQILIGMLAYLAVALVSISTVRWYTTRLCPPVAAFLIGSAALVTWSLPTCFAILLVGIGVLGVQMLHVFLTREF